MKRAVALLVSLLAAIAIGGCGGQPQAQSNPVDADAVREFHESNRITYDYGEDGLTKPEGRDDIPEATEPAGDAKVETQTSESDINRTLRIMSDGVEGGTFSGSGDDTFTIPSSQSALLFRFTQDVQRGQMFTVEGFNGNADKVGLIGEASSAPSGTFTNMDMYTLPTDAQVNAKGSWTIDVLPIDQMGRAENGGSYVGPQVLAIDADEMSKITFKRDDGSWFEAKGLSTSSEAFVQLASGDGVIDSTHVFKDPQTIIVVESWDDVPWTVSWE